MKHVTKGSPAPEFNAWKVSDDPNWTPGYGDLQNPQKRQLHESLLREQGWVCCYCGRQISPLDAHCESRFAYTLDGHIIPSDTNDTQAAYMVNLLKLDIAFLRDRRLEVVSRVFDDKFLATATLQELETLRDFFRARGAQDKAQSFGHVLARFAEQRLLDASKGAAS